MIVHHVPLDALECLVWGELGPHRSRRVTRHVRDCAFCHSRFTWMRRLPAHFQTFSIPLPRGTERLILERRSRGERRLLPARGP